MQIYALNTGMIPTVGLSKNLASSHSLSTSTRSLDRFSSTATTPKRTFLCETGPIPEEGPYAAAIYLDPKLPATTDLSKLQSVNEN